MALGHINHVAIQIGVINTKHYTAVEYFI